jgi:hypothetical protein
MKVYIYLMSADNWNEVIRQIRFNIYRNSRRKMNFNDILYSISLFIKKIYKNLF